MYVCGKQLECINKRGTFWCECTCAESNLSASVSVLPFGVNVQCADSNLSASVSVLPVGVNVRVRTAT